MNIQDIKVGRRYFVQWRNNDVRVYKILAIADKSHVIGKEWDRNPISFNSEAVLCGLRIPFWQHMSFKIIACLLAGVGSFLNIYYLWIPALLYAIATIIWSGYSRRNDNV